MSQQGANLDKNVWKSFIKKYCLIFHASKTDIKKYDVDNYNNDGDGVL